MNTNPKPLEMRLYAVLVCLLVVLFVAIASTNSRANTIADNDQQINETRLNAGYESWKAAKDTTNTNNLTK